MAYIHVSLAQSAAHLLQLLGSVPPATHPVPSGLPKLEAIDVPDLSIALASAGCSTDVASHIQRLYAQRITGLTRACSEHLSHVQERIAPFLDVDETSALDWCGAIHEGFKRELLRHTERLQSLILGEVRAAQLRHSTSPPPPPPPASDVATTTLSGHFTPAITALLQSAYDAHATGALPNKGERRELARATGLSEKQVVTWFGNTRQRQRKRRAREASGGVTTPPTATTTKRISARSVPYSLDMAPQHRRRQSSAEQRYPTSMQQPQQQRTWSFGSSSLNSSVGSSTSSLDLVEYAESAGDNASSAASTCLLPAPAPATKVQFDVSAALDPSGWFSVASSTASPASVTAADVTPRPPQRADAFLSLPAPALALEANQFTPAASTASSSHSPSSVWSPSPPNLLDSSFPTLAVADDELPYVPAPNDAWMDDEFYRNLFSSLGFEMEVGIGVDGLLGDGRMPGLNGGLTGSSGGGGGGLTLRMDDLQRGDAEFAMQL